MSQARTARALSPRGHALPHHRALLLGALLLVGLGSCSSLEFTRETQTSGRFRSTGLSFTILSFDVPLAAIDIARENAADSRATNLKIDKVRVTPDLGWFNWLLDIISVRRATIEGTWGFAGND